MVVGWERGRGERWMAVEQRETHQSLFLQREFILRERKQALALSCMEKKKKKTTECIISKNMQILTQMV